jgi:hypothetical protein
MGVKLNPLVINQIQKGTIIFAEDEQVSNVCLVVKGKVLIGNSGSKVIVGTGSFIGITDLFAGRTFSNYIAYEDTVLYAFPVSNIEELEKIYHANKDYRGLIIGSLSRFIVEYDKIYRELSKKCDVLYTLIDTIYNKYIELGKSHGKNIIPINGIEKVVPYESEFNEYGKIEYYQHFIKVPLDTLKAFYASSVTVTAYQVEEISVLISDIVNQCVERAFYIIGLYEILINNTESCLFKGVAKLTIDTNNGKGMNKELISMVEEIKDQIHSTEKLFINNIHMKLNSHNEFMEEIYISILTGSNEQDLSSEMQMKYSEKDATLATNEMNDSLKQILEYSSLDKEEADAFVNLIDEFKKLVDKYSADDKVRVMRRRLTDIYYKIYERVFLRSYEEKTNNRVIDMFLNYGFIDETLVSKEQAIELYYLSDNEKSSRCKVYSMKEWLTNIYEKRKEPSKNEFDLDYIENLRENKKTMKLTPEQEKEYLESSKMRLNFEITNMFRYNNRLVNGQVSTFVPFIFEDGIISDISNVYLNTDKINAIIEELLKTDYSIFHREVLYYDEKIGIKKEYIMEAVYPDIIMFPMYGQRSIMWQEITGKKRNTPGRFLFPVFTEGNIEDHFIKIFGQFRWELCRCLQGAAWNDIKYKSLTSEYSDYIQFYRKNRELSEDRKEKIKAQIQKGRHNTREIFVIDYEIWMKSEAKGALRLNKVAREILATYCPFSIEIRKKMSTQPLYEEAMARFNRNLSKKVKEIDLRFRALEKEKINIPDVLLETQKFYRDL